VNKQQVCELLGCDDAGVEDFEATAVTEDSRRVAPGVLFVAVSGERADGHAHAEEAVARGAVAVLGSRAGISTLHRVPYLHTAHPRRAAGLLAHALAGDPSRAIPVIGVTGTNGKSSIAALVESILAHAGFHPANFGTLGYRIGGESLPALHTTPFGEDLAVLFTQARTAGSTHVVMEVSSHALAQDRVAGIDFNVAAFSNLTQDHLDYHTDLEAYRDAKLKLFAMVDSPGGFTVVNMMDPAAERFIAASKVPCHTYGTGGDYKGMNLDLKMDGTQFDLKTPQGKTEVRLQLLGKHNVSNALCAAAICGGLGLPLEQIKHGLEALPSVPGRFEPVDAGQDFIVVVDYAHTEDGLLNVLKAARVLAKKRVIVVFGCGGDRDTGKRPKMGAIAAEYSDYAIITSDNPRTEDPHRILLDIEMGVQRTPKRKDEDYLVIENREEAIRRAIAMARRGDLVLIAGKGHEDYQILGTERIHFDDREIARAVLEGR